MNNFEGFSLEMLKNSKVKATQRRNSSEMKEFALTLYFYSPRSYEFLRKKICLVCPHVGMLSTVKKAYARSF